MAWIESHQELARHPKTKRFIRAIGISLPQAIGHLHMLWWWALDYAQSGELTHYTHEDIADAAGWEAQPTEFVHALIQSGFLDSDGDKVCIHDWWDYAGKLLERREKDRVRKRNAQGIVADGNSDGSGAESICNSNQPTEQNRNTQQKCNNKTKYAEFVSMTNDEYTSLIAKHGEIVVLRCIEILDNYKGATGKTYKSDYRAVLNWVVKRYHDEQKTQPGATVAAKPNRFTNFEQRKNNYSGWEEREREYQMQRLEAIDSPNI